MSCGIGLMVWISGGIEKGGGGRGVGRGGCRGGWGRVGLGGGRGVGRGGCRGGWGRVGLGGGMGGEEGDSKGWEGGREIVMGVKGGCSGIFVKV